MLIISPVRSEERILLHADTMCEAFKAIGMASYGKACFRLFEQSLDADHWALFHYPSIDTVRCIATASRVHSAAAEENINSFVSRCYRFDPTFQALKQRLQNLTCMVKMEIGDIRDREYRRCFEATEVRERLSFFSRVGSDLIQLSIYRGAGKRTFSLQEMTRFTTLASLVITTASKHEMLRERSNIVLKCLDIDAIERRLEYLPGGLSKREREVCARAAAGKSIEDTALDLDVRRTSVITYRQRAYRKLGICRQNELVALVNNLRSDDISYRNSAH